MKGPRKRILPTIFLYSRLKTLIKHPAFGALTLLGNGTILVGASILYSLEKSENPHIHSFLDTLWWAVATVTTVGYGEVSPQSTAGKWLGIGMMIFGTALFASFTALFATVLLRPDIEEVEEEIREVETSMTELRKEFLSDEQALAHATKNLESTLEVLRKLSRNRST